MCVRKKGRYVPEQKGTDEGCTYAMTEEQMQRRIAYW